MAFLAHLSVDTGEPGNDYNAQKLKNSQTDLLPNLKRQKLPGRGEHLYFSALLGLGRRAARAATPALAWSPRSASGCVFAAKSSLSCRIRKSTCIWKKLRSRIPGFAGRNAKFCYCLELAAPPFAIPAIFPGFAGLEERVNALPAHGAPGSGPRMHSRSRYRKWGPTARPSVQPGSGSRNSAIVWSSPRLRWRIQLFFLALRHSRSV